MSIWHGRIATALMAALLFSGCVSSTARTTPSARPSVKTTIVSIGTRAETTVGNTVIVYSYTSPAGAHPPSDATMVYAVADIEACAGANAPARTGVARGLFAVETPDKTGWPSVDPVKEPQLRPTYLKPNQCERGWVTFRLPKAQKPLYIVLLSSNIVKWKIP